MNTNQVSYVQNKNYFFCLIYQYIPYTLNIACGVQYYSENMAMALKKIILWKPTFVLTKLL